jgi:hypothetical protein
MSATKVLDSASAALPVAEQFLGLINKAFNTTSSRTVVSHETAQAGLEAVDLSCIRECVEIKPEKLPLYINNLLETYLPSNFTLDESKDMQQVLKRMLMLEARQFGSEVVHLTFANSAGCCILFRLDALTLPSSDFMYVAFSLTRTAFKMAQNVTVIRHQKKSFLRSKQWDEVVYTSHNLTKEDVTFIANDLTAAITSPPKDWLVYLPLEYQNMGE